MYGPVYGLGDYDLAVNENTQSGDLINVFYSHYFNKDCDGYLCYIAIIALGHPNFPKLLKESIFSTFSEGDIEFVKKHYNLAL